MRSEHAFIGGASDGGKTTFTREGHEGFHGVSIWCNHSSGFGDGFETDIAGYRASGREAMQTAPAKYESWTDVRINLRIGNIHECVQTAVEFAIDVWDTVGAPCQIIVDECHHLFDPDGDDVGTWILKEGRDKGIKGVFATQNPKAITGKPKDALLNVRYWVWVGEWPEQQKGWLDYYGYPRNEVAGERFSYAVMNRNMDVLYTAETDETFG